MNIDDYENKHFVTYEAFAETVRFILKKALSAAAELPHPQSIQYRAKGVESLRSRLAEVGNLDSQTLEQDRRDLAGVRVIFYTNSDVEQFLASTVIRDNFEIEGDSTKIHHPTPENKGAQYRGIHYTVRLREDRVRLPEYARFAGLRCEIQVQTILNHAWSETSHDILYKNKLSDGYGKKAMEGIARRFERIMDKYLIPAGYEIQKAQQEYVRVLQGKDLFDKDVVVLLDGAQNNNERYEILSALKDYAIPNYDDLPAAYEQLKGPLLRTAQAARNAEHVPIETTFGNMEGFKADAVSKLVVEIVEGLRYVDAVGTLQLLIDIFREEPSTEVKQQIVNAVKHLSEYNIDVYKQVGPMLQVALVDHLVAMDDAEVDRVRPIALAIWTEALESDITGQTWKADSMILRSGAVPISEQLIEVRDKAIKALFAAYDRSTDDSQRRELLSSLDTATRTPGQVQCPDELLRVTLRDAARIVEFMAERANETSYELLQHLEHRYLYDYFRIKGLAEGQGAETAQADATALIASILRFRDAINSDETFVRYKILVGFESVYPMHWADQNIDYQESEEYRRKETDRYVDEISAENEGYWFELATRCAETKSNDLATFPVFGDFIVKLGQHKPEVAERFLAKAGDDLRGFLAGFLNGLAASGRQDIYEKILADELRTATNLPGVMRHLRYSDVKQPGVARNLLERALEIDDTLSITECMLFAMQHYGTEKIEDADTFIRDALTYLNERKDPRWVWGAWFARKRDSKFYDDVSPERVAQMLENLGFLSKVDHQVEQVLARLAERYPEAVWDYFGTRLARVEIKDEDGAEFEAVPFRLHGLEKELSKDPGLAITKGLSWFSRDSSLFQFRGGRLLSAAFSTGTDEFFSALADLVREGGETETDFSLAVLRNYHGEAFTYVVLKEIVSRFPEDTGRLSGVRACIENTGVVHGELGFANAWRAKKESLTDWLQDDRQTVREFAEKEIASLELMIASEERRAEADKKMREMSYSEEDDPSDNEDDEIKPSD